MGLQTGKDVFGIAKQTALGSLATNPYFSIGLAGGGMIVDANQEADALTSAYLNPAGAFRDKVETGFNIETRAWLKSIGLFLYGVLGGLNTTGSGPYTHTFTLSTALPYLSMFETKGDASLHAIKDCKVSELEFSWEENAPVAVKASGPGGAWSVAATYTPTVNEADTVDYFRPVGGTFKFDADSGTAVVEPMLGGTITIKRDVEAWFYSGAITAGDNEERACEVEVALTLTPADIGLWKTLITGASGGTSIAATPTYGSFEVTFVNGTASLKLAADRVAFLCDFTEADPAGGSAKVEVSGLAYRNTTTPITVTLINSQATY